MLEKDMLSQLANRGRKTLQYVSVDNLIILGVREGGWD